MKDNRRRTRLPDGRVVEAVYEPVKPEQYPPDYEHRIIITESTRRGRTKRHAFTRSFPQAEGPAKWRPVTRGSLKELDSLEQQGFGSPNKPLPVGLWGSQRQRSLGISPNTALESGEDVHLADGVDIPVTMLAVILEAHASQARHEINLADIKVIVSQLGSRIALLEALSIEQRRLAEPALYTEILRRCTTI